MTVSNLGTTAIEIVRDCGGNHSPSKALAGPWVGRCVRCGAPC